jgi:hypothetical protein
LQTRVFYRERPDGSSIASFSCRAGKTFAFDFARSAWRRRALGFCRNLLPGMLIAFEDPPERYRRSRQNAQKSITGSRCHFLRKLSA